MRNGMQSKNWPGHIKIESAAGAPDVPTVALFPQDPTNSPETVPPAILWDTMQHQPKVSSDMEPT